MDLEVENKTSLMMYRDDNEESFFLKIYTRFPSDVNKYKGIFEQGYLIKGKHVNPLTYESNVAYALRFMIDTGVVGMSWLTVSHGKYTVRRPTQRKSRCQIEIDIEE